MKYWILPLFLFAAVMVVGQTNFDPAFMDASSDEPLALLDRPHKIGLEIPQGFLSHKRAFGCDAQVFLTENPIPPGTYEASETIIATGVVQSGTVTMRAADEVILDSDVSGEFEVQLGAVLEVTMGACTL